MSGPKSPKSRKASESTYCAEGDKLRINSAEFRHLHELAKRQATFWHKRLKDSEAKVLAHRQTCACPVRIHDGETPELLGSRLRETNVDRSEIDHDFRAEQEANGSPASAARRFLNAARQGPGMQRVVPAIAQQAGGNE